MSAPGPSLLRAWLPLAGVLLVYFTGCKANYRVGELVLVNWCDGQYPAFITAQKGRARYRVHFDGYEPRWDTDIAFQDIRGRLEQPPKPAPPLCSTVALALGVLKQDANSNPYREGVRVRVSWRGSVYRATVIEVLAPERFKVHYEGTESFLDEVIDRTRIVESQ